MKGLSREQISKEVSSLTQEAFAQAARTYGDTVYRVALHALNRREDAADVTQTVLLRLYDCDKEFESEEHMKH